MRAARLLAGAAWMVGTVLASEPDPGRPPAPTVTLAALRDQGFRVAGQLEAEPGTPYRILLITVRDCPTESAGTNFVALGEIELRTDADGHAAFSQVYDVRANDAQQVVARTMDASGDTSELSNCRPVAVELTYWEDVALRLNDTAGDARPGEPFTFVITLENQSETAGGRLPISGQRVRFELPEGTRFVSASDGGELEGTTVRFAEVTVPAEGDLRMTVTVLPLLVEVLHATASVANEEPYQSNNLAECEVLVDQSHIAQADVALGLTAGPEAVRAGMELRYVFSITNLGPDHAPAVVLTNGLPEAVRFLRATASQGSAKFADGRVTCALGALTNGASAEVVVAVQPRASGMLTNSGTVSVLSGIPGLASGRATTDESSPRARRRKLGDDVPGLAALARDPDPTNNLATVVVEVLPEQPLEPLGTPNFDPQTGLFEQVIRFTNVGAEPMSGLRLWVRGSDPGVLVLNRSGVEDGQSYLRLGRRVEAAETSAFVVEFYRPDREAVATPSYEIVEDAGGVWTPPPDVGSPLLRLGAELDGANLVLSWPAVPGETYVVQERPTVPEPWRTAGPALAATNAQGVWIQAGLAPTNAVSAANRFFRVLQLP